MRVAVVVALAAVAALFLESDKEVGATRAGGPPRIEVAFVLDATGSMGPYIQQAREQIKGIASELATGEPAPEIRFALVSYRDKHDDYVVRRHEFTSNIDTMKNHLDATHASGGGDVPEAALEGLDEAIGKLAWSEEDANVVKLIYLIGDAPAKHYPNGPTEASVARSALAKNIVIHSIVCGHMNSDGKKTWSKLARWTEGRTYKLGQPTSQATGVVAAAQAGGIERASLAAAVGGSARAYSTSVGVAYGDGELIDGERLEAASSISSGLRGGHARWIRDPFAWRDVWAAHVSLLEPRERPALPSIDFTTHAVIVAGGRDAGLAIDEIRVSRGVHAASLSPHADNVQGRVDFVVVELSGESK